MEEFIALARKIRDERVAAAVKEADEWLENVIKYVVGEKAAGLVAPQRAQEPVSAPISSTKRPQGRRAMIPKDSQSPTVLLLRKLIKSFNGSEFSTVEMRGKMEIETGESMNESQKANISNYLQQFCRGGEIELVKRGRGCLPSVYKAKDG